MRNPKKRQDEYVDDEGRIWPVVKLTPFDKRQAELRDLEAKRDEILSKGEPTAEDQKQLVMLVPLIERAQARYTREIERGKDDAYRKRRGIDEWRAGEGREEYNTSRRSRPEANADLSELTTEQKKQRKLDQTADSKWMKRCRSDGWSEERIQVELVVRIRKREADRAEKAQAAEDDAHMKALPNYGLF